MKYLTFAAFILINIPLALNGEAFNLLVCGFIVGIATASAISDFID